MGSEINCILKLDGKSFKGRALLETDELLFRGEKSLRIPFKEMKSVEADAGELSVAFRGGTASFTLEKKAENWREKILHPKSVIDKLGVKEESTVTVSGVTDQSFLKQLRDRTNHVSEKSFLKESDLIFYAVSSMQDLSKLAGLKKYLKMDGAIWVVSVKGRDATVKDTEVMAAGKKAGLVDTKVVGFSETHTALKFVIPVKKRQP